MKKYILISLAFFYILNCYSQNKQSLSDLPPNFGDKCYKHIEELASYGIRAAELPSETKTINYLSAKLAESGIKVTVDTFKYKYFKYDSAIVKYNNEKIKFSRLFINPYNKINEIKSEYFLLNTPVEKLEEKLNDKIIIASESYNFFDLFKINAEAIIVLNDSIFRKFEKQTFNSKISLKLFGKIEEYKTFNLIGSLNKNVNRGKNIIISAHWDSKVGPGADDNASGISVMLELAKYFQQIDSIPFNLKFIAFGAEEVGMLGSQAYMHKHPNEFKNCILNINLDAIGGNEEIMIETHKSSGEEINTFQKLPSTIRFCSSTNEKHNWIQISPEFYAITLFTEINQITWLDNTIKKASEDLKIKYRYGLSDGDHRILSLSGIPVMGINVPGNHYHVPGDIPETINKTSLENVGKLVNDIVLNIDTAK
jgi:hypothetical protein